MVAASVTQGPTLQGAYATRAHVGMFVEGQVM